MIWKNLRSRSTHSEFWRLAELTSESDIQKNEILDKFKPQKNRSDLNFGGRFFDLQWLRHHAENHQVHGEEGESTYLVLFKFRNVIRIIETSKEPSTPARITNATDVRENPISAGFQSSRFQHYKS